MEKGIIKTLLVDDEPDILELLVLTLKRMNIKADTATSLTSALEMLKSGSYQLCLTDLRLPDGSGMDIVRHIQRNSPNLPVAVISAHGTMEIAIESLKSGAFDFISKPINLNQLRDLIENALSLRSSSKNSSTKKLLGDSMAMVRLRDQINKLSRSMAPVHIHGESGTGKELVARLIHENGPNADKPFIAVNCGAIPAELMESEFFGHVKGSFTGATSSKPGLFKAAEHGTLFLDEIADLPLNMQSKLLRAIQERAIRPVGGHSETPVNCRILSATHKPLRDLVEAGDFRQDLFYRVNVIDLEVPALREHLEDIGVLSVHILARISTRNGITHQPELTDESIGMLGQYNFPGNVRELENILERATALCDQRITPDDLSLHNSVNSSGKTGWKDSGLSLDDYLESLERKIILDVLAKNKNNKTKTAGDLGITFRSLRYKCKKLEIE